MMEMMANLAFGFEVALSPTNLLYCFLGVSIGTFVGVLPGLGALATISMLLPLTFHLPATTALVMLGGIYYGTQYGGSIASILLNLPGSPSGAVACLDGYPMAKQGRAGIALLITAVASFVGASVGILLLSGFGPVLARVGLAFGPSEYFSMMMLGLVAAGTIAHGSALKGLAMVVLGVLLGLVGTDINTATQRYTFGLIPLFDGITLVAIAMGLFGVSEVIASVNRPQPKASASGISFRSMIPTRDDVRRSVLPILRGSGVGSFFGTLPGTGASIAAFMAYAVEKRITRNPKRFGAGAIEGVAAPEAANNAGAQTSFIPTLTLGIPGDAIMALMLGAMIVHGITPGPQVVTQHPDLFWGLVASFWIGNVILLILNVPLIGIWIRILEIPYNILYPAILLFVCVGVFSVNNSVFDVFLVAVFGGVGYGMRLLGFEPAPLMVGFILGPMLEENFRRALVISRGDLLVFVDRPISAGFLIATGLVIAWSIWIGARIRAMAGVPRDD